MKNLVFVFILYSTIIFSQNVDFYSYGNYYVDSTIVYTNPIVGQGKEGVVLWTDKPIDIIHIKGKHDQAVIKGITFEYRGQVYGKEVSAVYVGGEGKHTIRDVEFNFDVKGDKSMYAINYSGSHPKNKNFIEYNDKDYDFSYKNIHKYKNSYTGSGAHALFIDYENAKDWSSFTGGDLNIRAYRVNTGLKVITKKGSNQYLNTNNIKLKTRGAKTHFFIDKMGSGTLFVNMQELKTLSENERELPYFYFNGEGTLLSLQGFDRKGIRNNGGYIKGERLTLTGESLSHGLTTGTPFLDAIIDAEIMVSPYTLDTFNKQTAWGDKTFMNTVKIHRNKGKLIINGKEIRPIKNYNPKNLKSLIDMLKKTGIIYE